VTTETVEGKRYALSSSCNLFAPQTAIRRASVKENGAFCTGQEAVQDAIHGFFARFNRAAALQLTSGYVPAPRLLRAATASDPSVEQLPIAA
jgi:hypothetical protein